MDSSQLNNFIHGLLEKADGKLLPEGYREEYEKRLKSTVLERLSFYLLSEMDDSCIERFSQELGGEERSMEEKFEILQKYIPNLEEKKQEILDQFEKTFLLTVRGMEEKEEIAQ